MDQKGITLYFYQFLLSQSSDMSQPVLQARNLVKKYGHVVATDGSDFDLYAGEILAVIGDNGAGKSTLIKMLSGAEIPDHGEIKLGGKVVQFQSPIEARDAGIETVYQNLALSPALSITDNMFLGREVRKKGVLGKFFRSLDHKLMQDEARQHLNNLGLLTIQSMKQNVENTIRRSKARCSYCKSCCFW